ncbi:short chain dehydrogenase/reductase [Sporothrix brasiliensis 5110]|uniref:Short chain dehydrogenase/reductase n=1 Tax=Sporothrix brasiliensis 5110 TaxID=1398154 RepID=A0A0C2FGR2_9PEZI|nr:short chain dehydrogenase/reductase [Sporothrix brasiliensis 5110]KIH90253.1 short chain dehydrogenase/reductase [Sporothrix brasiliensis 5110]
MNTSRVAVVTGGASGIGRAMARYFVDQQYGHVAVLDVNKTSGGEAVAELKAASSGSTQVSFLECDVASWVSQAAAFRHVYDACGGRIDVVMANAGISENGESPLVAEAMKDEDEDEPGEPSEPSMRTLNVNLVGTIFRNNGAIKLATHYMKKNTPAVYGKRWAASRGRIICTASNAGLYPFPVAPIYAASKNGVIGLVRSLAQPLERAAIEIFGLAPAVLETNIAPNKDLFKAMKMTPMTTLTKGVNEILTGSELSGGVAEIHGENVTFRAAPEFVDADSEANINNFWNLGYA